MGRIESEKNVSSEGTMFYPPSTSAIDHSKPISTKHSLGKHGPARQTEAGNYESRSGNLELPPTKKMLMYDSSKQTIFHQPCNSAIEKYAFYLKSVYTKQKLPMYDKLPQIKVKKYIELTFIRKDDITPKEADKFTRATIHGDLHEITRKKQAMTFHQIAQLEDGSHPKCILIEGAPGIGKSTFSWKLCRKWGKRKILQHYKVLVMLRLRDNRVRHAKDILHLFRHPDKDTREAAVKEISERRGEGLLLLLDGFDELPSSLRLEDSLFMRIIRGLEVPEATVMITSRPSASSYLLANCRDHISQHIEIIGFTQENVQSYLKRASEGDPSLHTGLKDYLSCYPHMQSMMYVPLNCAIVTEVYKNNSSKDKFIPKTMSDLYSSLVRSLLLRYLHDHPVHGRKLWRLRNFSELPPDVFQQLCQLGRIAYEGIVHGQQVIFPDLPSDFDGLGLMQSVNELYVDEGTAVSFSFFHLTLQEYMAAWHLSEQPIERQIKCFQEYGHKVCNLSMYDLFIEVLRFLAGLKKFEGYPTDSIRSFLTNSHSSDSTSKLQITLDGLHWIFESQHASSICKAIGMATVNPQVRYKRLTAFNCFVLGYCVSHSNCPWELHLQDCCIKDEEIELLVQGALEGAPSYSGYISRLNVRDNHITSSGLNKLIKVQKRLKLNKLDLHLNPLGNGGAVTLLQSSVALGLKVLRLWRTGIGAEDCIALGKLLSSSSGLKTLNVGHNDLTPEAIQSIFSGFQENTTLKHLWLDGSLFGSGGAVTFLKSGVVPKLKSLLLSSTGIGEEDCRVLSELLSSSTRLARLNIRNNGLTPIAMEILVSGLQHNTTLDILAVDGNSFSSKAAVTLLKSQLAHRLRKFSLTMIGEEDCQALGELLSSSQNLLTLVCAGNDDLPPEAMELIITGLQHNTRLEKLWMLHFPFSHHNCTSLASVLQHHPLQLLKLDCFSVDTDGASELAKALIKNNTLQNISLAGTPIGTRGATAFAEKLTNNTSLKDLILNHESIGPEGTLMLIESLLDNATLSRLTLPEKYESFVSTNKTYTKERDRIRWRVVSTSNVLLLLHALLERWIDN